MNSTYSIDYNYTISTYDCFDKASVFIIAQITEATVMTAINLLVMVLYVMMKKRRYKISNYLLLSQSVTDMYTAICLWFELFLQMSGIVDHMNTHAFTLANIGMLEYSLVLSLGTILVGTFERYLSVTRSYYHKVKVTLVRLVYVTILTWIMSLIPVLIFLSLMKFDPRNAGYRNVKIFSYVFDAIMLFIIIGVVYTLVMTLKTAQRSFKFQRPQCYSNIYRRKESVKAKKAKSIRLLVIFIIMITAYTVSFLPYIFGRLMYDTDLVKKLSVCINWALTYTFHMLYKFSALFNPFLTILLKEDFRNTLFHLISKPTNFIFRESFRMTRTARLIIRSDSKKTVSPLL